jgi:hypothetical protein
MENGKTFTFAVTAKFLVQLKAEDMETHQE